MKKLVFAISFGLIASCGVVHKEISLDSNVKSFHYSGSTLEDFGEEVEFVIPEGTGRNAWNDEASMIELFVGDSLIIQNNDSVTHQLHTSGSPCPHGEAIDPGETWTCEISQPYDPSVNQPIYDHIGGRSARVWLRAIEKPETEDNGQESDANLISTTGTSTFYLDTIYEQNNISLEIPDNDNAVFHEFQLESTGFIDKFQLQIRLIHTYIGDLRLKIVSPDGTEVVLHDRTGGSTDNMDVTWGPEGVQLEALLQFSGKEAYGTWKFSIQDMAQADVGYFNYIKVKMSRTFL